MVIFTNLMIIMVNIWLWGRGGAKGLVMTQKLDSADRQILSILKEDAHTPARTIARKTKLPVTTVYNRIRRLEQEGVIKKYSVVLDHEKIGLPLIAYAFLYYDIALWKNKAARNELKRNLMTLPNIEEVKYVIGQFDILLKFRVKDMDELNNILFNHLRSIPGVGRTETFLVVEDVL